jgi:hypothetical protein
MRAFGLRRSAFQALLFWGAAPDTTIIPRLLPRLNPYFSLDSPPKVGQNSHFPGPS